MGRTLTRVSTVVFLGLLSVTSLGGETKGLRVVPINDASGKQVGLYKGSYALVLGVSAYTAGWPNLPSVAGETEQISAALEANGFVVQKVLNPNQDRLRSAFQQFIDSHGYEKENRLLVFFSGHGYSRQKGAKGYLVPVDAPDPRKDEKGFLRKALPMSQVLAWCRQMEAKHALFLLDSCFSGTIFKTRALPDVPPHISAVTSRPVRQFIAAGDAGEEVPAESVFAKCFLRALRGDADLSGDGYVTGTELGLYLRDKVVYYQTGQTPQYGKIRDPDLDEGDFVFAVTGSASALNAPPVMPSTHEATAAEGGLRFDGVYHLDLACSEDPISRGNYRIVQFFPDGKVIFTNLSKGIPVAEGTSKMRADPQYVGTYTVERSTFHIDADAVDRRHGHAIAGDGQIMTNAIVLQTTFIRGTQRYPSRGPYRYRFVGNATVNAQTQAAPQ